jgi:hypothetical protein
MKTLSALTFAAFIVAAPAFAHGVGVGISHGSRTDHAADRATASEFTKVARDAGSRAPIVLARAF